MYYMYQNNIKQNNLNINNIYKHIKDRSNSKSYDQTSYRLIKGNRNYASQQNSVQVSRTPQLNKQTTQKYTKIQRIASLNLKIFTKKSLNKLKIQKQDINLVKNGKQLPQIKKKIRMHAKDKMLKFEQELNKRIIRQNHHFGNFFTNRKNNNSKYFLRKIDFKSQSYDNKPQNVHLMSYFQKQQSQITKRYLQLPPIQNKQRIVKSSLKKYNYKNISNLFTEPNDITPWQNLDDINIRITSDQ